MESHRLGPEPGRLGRSDGVWSSAVHDPALRYQGADRQALVRTFRASDLVLSGGGSLLQDTTSLRSLIYYLWVVRLAQRHGAPVMFYAQGIGPLKRRSARSITRFVADRVRRITVRDPDRNAISTLVNVPSVGSN